MTRRETLILAAAAAASRPLTLRAQFTSSVSIVNVQVTIRDKQGQLVRGLTRDDFDVTDEGKKQAIRYFSADSDQPLTIGLLFDLSRTQRTVLPLQTAVAMEFLEQVMRSGDRAFVAGFDQRYTMTQAATDSREQLVAGLKKLEFDDFHANGTAVFDAVAHAGERMQREPGRKVIVVLSDGQDTKSVAQLGEAINEVQRADATIYTIRIFDREVFAFNVPSIAASNLEQGRVALEKMAKETGGRMFEGSNKAPLEETFRQLNEELRAQYSLGFPLPGGRPGYHRLRVKVSGKGLTVQARAGYFAEASGSAP